VLALDDWNVAICGVRKVSSHDDHLRVFDNITRKQSMRCSSAWYDRIPLDPFESRHRKNIDIVVSLRVLEHEISKKEMVYQCLLLHFLQNQIHHRYNWESG
jgi:hypothetical protein